jgi:DNA-binding transcriptional MerR regulator
VQRQPSRSTHGNARRTAARSPTPSRTKASEKPIEATSAEEPGPKRYYRIGEVSRLTGVKAHVLRYWESEFRWMAPAKSRSQQRLYRQRDIEVILLLKRLLHEERFTIAGARKRLRELGVAKALEAPQLDLGLEIDHVARYRRIREELEAIKSLL